MTPALTAIPGFLMLTLCYGSLCAVAPFGRCLKCRGFGRKLRKSRLTGRLKPGPVCRRCHGHGWRIRTGRRLFNYAARLHREGTTAPAVNPPGRKQH